MIKTFFVSGVPCTGKTWLGTWLAENKGFLHVDAEKNGGSDLDIHDIHTEWDHSLETGRAHELVRKIATLSSPVVLNWGFKMPYMYFVRALQVAGIEAWWINGNPIHARAAFITRSGIPVSCFDAQMGDIRRNEFLLQHVFGERTISGLSPSGEQRHPEEMWGEMNQKSVELTRLQ